MIAELSYALERDDDAPPWRVLRVALTERLSEPFAAVIELASDDPELLHPHDGDIAAHAWVGRRAALRASRGGTERRIAGVITDAEDLGLHGDQRLARVRLAPSLERLADRSDWRIFQDLDVTQIVAEVFADAGLYPGARYDTRGLRGLRLPRRGYCAQFGERDADFIARLLEDEGLGYRFESDGLDDVFVLFDGAGPRSFTRLAPPDGEAFTVLGPDLATAHEEGLRAVERVRALRPESVTLRDFDFMSPDALESTTLTAGAGPRARYRYGATLGFVDDDALMGARRHDGSRRASAQHHAAAQGVSSLRGAGNVLGFSPGATFTLDDDPTSWLLVSVTHRGHAPEAVLREGAAEDRYHNTFEALPAQHGWRPPRATPRPRADAPQTATVEAMPGSAEPVCVDALGRVLVRFHWERAERRSASQRARPSSCWLRVASPWAGTGFGVMFLPRVGMEVVVQFLDGDPDRPVVTGSLYNARNVPPLSLPAQHARSTVHTRTLGADVGHNELRFDDSPGAEELLLRAQRDLVEQVLNNRSVDVAQGSTLTVGADSTLTVGVNRVETVGAERVTTVMGGESATVLGARRLTVGEADERTVRGDAEHVFDAAWSVRVGGSLDVTVGVEGAEDPPDARLSVRGSQHVLADEEVVVQARRALVLRCGESRVVLRPDGVEVHAPRLTLHATDEAVLRTDDSSFILGDDAELCADDVRLFGVGARLELGTEATLRGAKVHLGQGGGKPAQLVKDDATQAVFRFVQGRSKQPLANVAVRIRHPDGEVRAHATDADGYVRIDGAEHALYEVVGTVDAEHLDLVRARARRRA